MNNLDKIKEKYVEDTETMASKSRFGYFSVLPSHTAAHTDFPHQPGKSIVIKRSETAMAKL